MYPKMSRGWVLHLTPKEGFIHRKNPLERISSGSYIVDREGKDIVALCDGSRTYEDVLKGVLPDPPRSTFHQRALSFIKAATQKGHIEWTRQKSDSCTIPTGSPDFYVPLHLSLELTGRCNLSCIYCYTDFSRNPTHLDVGLLLEVLSEWHDLGLVGIEITSGEPLIHPDFFTVLEFCAQRFFPLAVLTNGTLVDEATARQIAEIAPHCVIGVSLDGPTARVHDHMRGRKGAFDRATRAIRLLSKAALNVRVAMQVTQFNVWSIERTLQLAKKLGARWFGWSPVLPFGRGKAVAWQWDPSLSEQIAKMEKSIRRKYHGFVVDIDDRALSLLDDFGNCGVGYKHAVLSPSGRIRACLFMKEDQSFGEVRSESLRQIFSKDILRILREVKVPRPEECHPCKFTAYCAYCPLRAVTVIQRAGITCRWAEQNCGMVSIFAEQEHSNEQRL